MSGLLGPIVAKDNIIQYAQGAAQKAVQPIADFIAPTVQVASLSGFYTRYSEKARFRIPKTERGPRQRATQLARSGEAVAFQLTPHALDFPVDEIDKLSAGQLENVVMEAADELAEVASLSHERDVVETAIDTVGNGTAKTWNSSSNPVNDIDAAILAVAKAAKSGSAMEVGVLFGPGAFVIFKNAAAVTNKFIVGQSKSGGGAALAIPTIETAGSLFIGIPECRISFMCYDTAPEGKDADIAYLLDNVVLVFARKANPTRHDPSFMKTLRPRGQWMVPGAYTSEDGRQEVAKMDWYSKIISGNSTAAVRLNISA